jgi:hypothetical protein
MHGTRRPRGARRVRAEKNGSARRIEAGIFILANERGKGCENNMSDPRIHAKRHEASE